MSGAPLVLPSASPVTPSADAASAARPSSQENTESFASYLSASKGLASRGESDRDAVHPRPTQVDPSAQFLTAMSAALPFTPTLDRLPVTTTPDGGSSEKAVPAAGTLGASGVHGPSTAGGSPSEGDAAFLSGGVDAEASTRPGLAPPGGVTGVSASTGAGASPAASASALDALGLTAVDPVVADPSLLAALGMGPKAAGPMNAPSPRVGAGLGALAGNAVASASLPNAAGAGSNAAGLAPSSNAAGSASSPNAAGSGLNPAAMVASSSGTGVGLNAVGGTSSPNAAGSALAPNGAAVAPSLSATAAGQPGAQMAAAAPPGAALSSAGSMIGATRGMRGPLFGSSRATANAANVRGAQASATSPQGGAAAGGGPALHGVKGHGSSQEADTNGDAPTQDPPSAPAATADGGPWIGPGQTPVAKPLTAVTPPSTSATADAAASAERLRDAVNTAVNHAAMRAPAVGQLEVPGLGRVAVRARSVGGDVDIQVTADRPEARAALRLHGGAIATDLREGDVKVGRLTIEKPQSTTRDFNTAGSGGSFDTSSGRRNDPSPRDSGADSDEADPAAIPGASARVRIVL